MSPRVGTPVAPAVKLLRGFFPKGRSEQAVPPAACQLRPSNDLEGEDRGVGWGLYVGTRIGQRVWGNLGERMGSR